MAVLHLLNIHILYFIVVGGGGELQLLITLNKATKTVQLWNTSKVGVDIFLGRILWEIRKRQTIGALIESLIFTYLKECDMTIKKFHKIAFLL